MASCAVELSPEQLTFLEAPQRITTRVDLRKPLALALWDLGLSAEAIAHDACGSQIRLHQDAAGHEWSEARHCKLCICDWCALRRREETLLNYEERLRFMENPPPCYDPHGLDQLSMLQLVYACPFDRDAIRAILDNVSDTLKDLLFAGVPARDRRIRQIRGWYSVRGAGFVVPPDGSPLLIVRVVYWCERRYRSDQFRAAFPDAIQASVRDRNRSHCREAYLWLTEPILPPSDFHRAQMAQATSRLRMLSTHGTTIDQQCQCCIPPEKRELTTDDLNSHQDHVEELFPTEGGIGDNSSTSAYGSPPTTPASASPHRCPKCHAPSTAVSQWFDPANRPPELLWHSFETAQPPPGD